MIYSSIDDLRLKMAERLARIERQDETTSTPPTPAPTSRSSTSTSASKPDPWTGPIPPLDAITLLRATLWDNGTEPKIKANGNKGKRTRFGLTVEVYEQPADELARSGIVDTFTWKKNVQLRPTKKFLELASKNKKTGRVSAEFYDLLAEYTAICTNPRDLFGFVVDNRSWAYHQEQFVYVTWEGDVPRVAIVRSGEALGLDDWDVTENPTREIKAKYMAEIDAKGYRKARAEYIARTRGED